MEKWRNSVVTYHNSTLLIANLCYCITVVNHIALSTCFYDNSLTSLNGTVMPNRWKGQRVNYYNTYRTSSSYLIPISYSKHLQ